MNNHFGQIFNIPPNEIENFLSIFSKIKHVGESNSKEQKLKCEELDGQKIEEIKKDEELFNDYSDELDELIVYDSDEHDIGNDVHKIDKNECEDVDLESDENELSETDFEENIIVFEKNQIENSSENSNEIYTNPIKNPLKILSEIFMNSGDNLFGTISGFPINTVITTFNGKKMQNDDEIFSDSQKNTPEISNDISINHDHDHDLPKELNDSDKITLNIGGKKFNLRKQLLKQLNIKYYNLLDTSCLPKSQLKINKLVDFITTTRHDNIIKLIVRDQLFETSDRTLSKSSYFKLRIKTMHSNKMYIDEDPKVFRYVLNFLRYGEICIFDNSIINMLEKYDIEFSKSMEINSRVKIVPYQETIQSNQIKNHMQGYLYSLNPHNYPIPGKPNEFYSFENYPINEPDEKLSALYGISNMNIINTESKLIFGSDIIFELTSSKFHDADLIEDLLISIDIPILKQNDYVEYVDLI